MKFIYGILFSYALWRVVGYIDTIDPNHTHVRLQTAWWFALAMLMVIVLLFNYLDDIVRELKEANKKNG